MSKQRTSSRRTDQLAPRRYARSYSVAPGDQNETPPGEIALRADLAQTLALMVCGAADRTPDGSGHVDSLAANATGKQVGR
jgi:hypothetical protein